MTREDREDKVRGPYMAEHKYEELKDLTDTTDKNVRDTLEHIITVFSALDGEEQAYKKIEKLSENEDEEIEDVLVKLIDVCINDSGGIIVNPVKAKMD